MPHTETPKRPRRPQGARNWSSAQLTEQSRKRFEHVWVRRYEWHECASCGVLQGGCQEKYCTVKLIEHIEALEKRIEKIAPKT